MMATSVGESVVVGLDIGSTKVCAVAGRLVRNNKNQETLEVLGVGRTRMNDGVAKGSVVNVNNAVSAIHQVIDEVASQINMPVDRVNVSFNGSHVVSVKSTGNITRSSAGDEIQKEDIDHLLNDMYRTAIPADKEIIHVLPMDFTVDNEVNIDQPVGRNGVKLGADFQIITAQANAARNVRKCVVRNELTLDTMMLSVLASGLSVLTEEEKYAGVALIDIGGGTTQMAIYYRNVLRHVAVFPWAGNSLTSDIQLGCKIMPEQAEQLKKKFGSASPADFNLNQVVAVPGLSNKKPKDVLIKNVAIIIEDRLREIAAMVQAEILRSGYEGKLLGGLVLTGGTAMISGIEPIFSRVTGAEEVRVGYPEHLEPNGRADLVGDPAYATAVGLVWAGYKTLDRRISFISDPVRAKYNERPTMERRPTPEPVAEKPEPMLPAEPERVQGEGFFDRLLKTLFPPKGSPTDTYE